MRLFPAAVWLLVVVPATAAEVDYQRDIKPLLLHKCGACHGALRQQAGLRLDAGQLIRKGGESGPAVEPGNSAASLLLERVTETDETLRMPPTAEGEALTADQITLLKDWINQGAKSPDDEQIPEDPAAFWSYQSPSRPAVPEVKSKAWVRTPIDAFIASAREQHGLVASAEARPEVWLRRVYLDLIGLPPTREELHEFLGDTSDTAYESVVDRLLSRPEYGERWGRHWMDVWRYSDWYGSRSINEIRYSQRHIWRWRDWIVDSINADKSYDRMILEMLAGDELAPADPDVLRATGFLGRNWYKFDRNVWMFETVEQTSQAFLGLTLRCARCHDHKYDPISQEEYYRFRAFFEPHDVRTDPLAADTAMQKDATLGMVLTDGVSRTFDKELDTETYLFQRGDNRYPDTSHPLTPGVPASLGGPEITIQPISLPPEAWYPYLRPELSDGLIEVATEKTREAETALQTAKAAVTTRENAIAAFESRVARTTTLADGTLQPILVDDFSTRQDVWKVLSGDWTWEKGQLAQRAVSSFATIYADVTHPRDFVARVKYRTLEAGMYRSVGFSFDFIDTGNSQDVYTSTGDAAQSVQAFHRRDGKLASSRRHFGSVKSTQSKLLFADSNFQSHSMASRNSTTSCQFPAATASSRSGSTTEPSSSWKWNSANCSPRSRHSVANIRPQ